MERARKSKQKPSLDSILFSSAEQRLLRFLLTEPTTAFSPRVLSSKLKGVRGLGGADGIIKILHQLEEVGLVQFVNNGREAKLQNDNMAVQILKTISAVCDLEGLAQQLRDLSKKGILFGAQAEGLADSDSAYEIYVVSEAPEDVRRVVSKHPLGKRIEVTSVEVDEYVQISRTSPGLATQLDNGLVLWGSG